MPAAQSPPERVCAVVVTYNRRDLLHECLTALEGQTRPVDRLLVIDNASTDGTPEMVREEHPNVDFVRLEENRGGAGGFHEGTRRAYDDGYDWLWLMDDDTIPTKTALEELLAAPGRLNGLPRPLVLASRVLMPDGRLHPFNRPPVDQRDPNLMVEAVARGMLPIRHTSFVAAFVHRDAITAVGLPLADYFIWIDDVEFTARILREHAGYAVPSSVVVHKSHTLGTTQAGERYYYSVRNTLWLLRSGSLRGDRATWSRLVVQLTDGIPRFLALNRYSPTALRTVARALRDGFRRLPRS
jgi:rhamnopyranosyl-N-acetylglucosaminyl-diphospho-decaprenol beta-1,3/1,4-galactofuranosyltransferase